MDSEHIEFTPLSSEDRKQWQPLCQAYEEGSDYSWDDNKANIVWSWLHDPSHPIKCLVAKCNEQMIGYINYRETAHTGYACSYGYIQDLYVSPDYRRRGIAQRLIEQVAEIGRQRGWKFLRWTTYADNDEAQ